MNSSIVQLLVLAGVAIFLILRLRSVLGTRDGFEKPRVGVSDRGQTENRARHDFEVIEGGADRDITDHVKDGTDTAKALAAMKMADPQFSVSEFLQGAKSAYEWILDAFEKGDLEEIRPFLGPEVAASFAEVIDHRADEGLVVEATIVGVRDVDLVAASFDRDTSEGEISVRFLSELTSVVRDSDGDIVEGDPNEIIRQRDTWTFARVMGSDDPNWRLVATGE